MKAFFYKQETEDTEEILHPGDSPKSPAHFQSPLFFDIPHTLGEMDGTRKAIKFWMERLILNSAGELSTGGLGFTRTHNLIVPD